MRALSLLALLVPAISFAGDCPIPREAMVDAFDSATIAHEMGHNLGMVVAMPVDEAGWPAPIDTFWLPEVGDEVLAAVRAGEVVLALDAEADGCTDRLLRSADADFDPLALDALAAASRWAFTVEISGVAAGY